MQTASLQIRTAPDALTFSFIGPDSATMCRTRSVHPEDLAAARAALSEPPASLEALEAMGRRLYSRLFERDIRDALFSGPALLLTLDADLPEIPWELAFGEGRFLADAHATGRGTAVDLDSPRASLRVLMVVNPTGDLPYSDSEAAQIAERLRHVGRVHIDTLSGAAATRGAILNALESQPYDAIHFSCHAEHVVDAPEKSHVRAYDGPLTAEDLYQAAMARPPLLWVLNACESGRCAGAGPMAGLAAALRGAGAAAVVGTLWPVNNKCAGFAMSAMYAALASGDAVGEALRAARAQTRRVFANDPMLTWAAFALYGAPGARLITTETRVRLGRAPLAGRDVEWAALEATWAEARAGRFRAALITGGQGLGKTRLLEEWLASLTNVAVLTFAPDGGVGEILAQVGLHLSGALSPVRAAEAIADWAGGRGGIVVCDGLDRAAPEVVETVQAIARPGSETPLLLLLTTGDARLAERLSREALWVIPLRPLNREGMASIFSALDGELPDGLEQATPGEAERLALGLPANATPGAMANALPEGARQTLRAGAIVGNAFTVADLTALLEEPERALWPLLDQLCGEGWLMEGAPGSFRFQNASDRPAILDAFHPLGERNDLHRRQARRCLAEERYEEAGAHWEASDEAQLAIEAYQAAFRRAARNRDATAVLSAHARLDTLGAEPDDALSLRAVASALGETGEWARARDSWNRVVDATPDAAERSEALVYLAEAEAMAGELLTAQKYLSDAERLGGMSAAADVIWAETLIGRCQPDQALHRAKAALARADSPELAARAALAGAKAALMLPDAEEAITLCHTALESGGDAAGHRTALRRTLARARQYSGDYAEAEAVLIALRDEQRDTHQPHERAATLLALAELWRDQGRLEPALSTADEALALGQHCGQPAHVADAENLRCSILRRQGRYGPALEAAARAGETAKSAGLAPASIHAHILSATVLGEQGQMTAARAASETAIMAAEAAGYGYGLAWAKTILATVYLDAGDPATAGLLLEEALQVAHSIRGNIGICNALYYRGWVAWDTGDGGDVYFAGAKVGAARISYRAVQCPAAFGRALCTNRVRASEEALNEVEALNMGALAAWLRARRGTYHLERGHHNAAAKDLTSSYRVARRLGMRALHARAAGLLALLYDKTGDSMAAEMRDESEALWSECMSGWE